MRRFAIIGLAIAAISGGAEAQVPKALVECAAIVADADRLACYDGAVKAQSADARKVAETREAEAAKIAAAAAATVAVSKQADFGNEGVRGFGKREEDRLGEIGATLSEVLKDGNGKMVFVLDNGQIWRQADGFRMPNARPGAPVTVKRGAMGSYRLAVEGSNRTVQVIRMR